MASQEPKPHLREGLNISQYEGHGLGPQAKSKKRSIRTNVSHITVWPRAVLLQVSELHHMVFLSHCFYKLLIPKLLW